MIPGGFCELLFSIISGALSTRRIGVRRVRYGCKVLMKALVREYITETLRLIKWVNANLVEIEKVSVLLGGLRVEIKTCL